MRIFLFTLLVLLALPFAANAKPIVDRVPPLKLSAQDRADIARIETYLNEMKNIAADFMQVDDKGGIMRGTLAIQRPGKMRVTYAAPSHDFIVADGDFVHIWDGDLRSQTNVPEDSSLANFILRDPISLSGDVTITKFERFPAKMELTLAEAGDPAAGQLTLIFEDHPLILRQWRVIDPQGRKTGVNLENEETEVEFAGNMFDFVPPNFGVGGKARQSPAASVTNLNIGGDAAKERAVESAPLPASTTP